MIKTKRVFLMSSALALGLSLPCSADQIQGQVEGIDSLTDIIMIKDPVSGLGKAVHVHHKTLSDVRIGSIVKATFQSGSDTADTLEVLIPTPRP